MERIILSVFFVLILVSSAFSQSLTVLENSNSFEDITEQFQTIANEISLDFNYFSYGMETNFTPVLSSESKRKIGEDKFVILWMGATSLDLNFLFLYNVEAKEAVVFSFRKEFLEGHIRYSPLELSIQLVSFIWKFYNDPKWYQNAEAHYKMGYEYFLIGDINRSIAEYTEAISLNQNYADAYYSRGSVYAQTGNFTQAISDYSNAIRINPNDAEAYYNRGNAYYETGSFDSAISDFNSVIRLNPEYINAYLSRGIVYFDKGDIPSAIVDWETFLQSCPDHAGVINNLEIARQELAK